MPAEVEDFLRRGPKQLLIGRSWRGASSGAVSATVNPATGAPFAQLAEAGPADVDSAVAAARSAFEGPWRRWTPAHRMQVMLRLGDLVEAHEEQLSLLDTLEMGAPRTRALGAVRSGLARLRWNATQATSIRGETPATSLSPEFLTYTRKEPVGVVAAIIPWNSPVASALWKLGPVLATGCTVVVKPAEEAALSVLRLAELCLEAGVPDGVVNVVTGEGPVVGAALAQHRDVDKVAFTGSLEAARAIIRASAGNVKRLSLELGGKSPNIVFADADLEAAAIGAANGVFANSGQICSAGTRLFVERPAYEELVARVISVGQSLRVGDGLDPTTDIGPLVSEHQLDRVLGYIDTGVRAGARLASGGHRPRACGYFVDPTVFADVTDDMVLARDEIFGPVLAVLPFDTEEEAVRRANSLPVGLASGVWTSDGGRAHRLARDLRAGTVWINCYQVMDPAMPFGGFGLSGYGREGGVQHLEHYLEVKSVYTDLRV